MADRIDYAILAIGNVLKMLDKADRRLCVQAMVNVIGELDNEPPVVPEPLTSAPRLTLMSGVRS